MTKLCYTITKIREDEVEISFESWNSKHHTVWRMVLKNNTVEVAKPGRGNTFNLSYQWIFKFGVYGYGTKKISNIIKYELPKQYLPDNPSDTAITLYNAHCNYIKQVANLLIEARNILTSF